MVAAGSSTRMGMQINKLMLPLLGKPVLSYCLTALENCCIIDEIILVCSPSQEESYRSLCKQFHITKAAAFVHGGDTRTQSVLNGLQSVTNPCDYVLIQDGARPLLHEELIQNCLTSAMQYGSGVAAGQVIDTIKIVDEKEIVSSTPARDRLRAVQTPQAFSFEALLCAYQEADKQGFIATDDAALMEKMGYPVHLVHNPKPNIKLTTKDDVLMLEALMQKKSVCVNGFGYDVHRLVTDRPLILCGIHIPYEKGLLGHSDADVAVHALMDALLSCAGLGDIGRLFPDNDPKYEGADSCLLLKEVCSLLEKEQCRVLHADITIVCQNPRLASYMPKMVEKVSQILSLPTSFVNIKATTTEKLGFTGDGSGIAAYALASCDRFIL